MCDPITAIAAAGTAISAVGQIQQGKATAADAAYQRRIAQANADLTTQQARDASVRGTDAEQQVMEAATLQTGATRAALAANNFDTNFGSPLELILQSSREGAEDARRTRQNTEREYDDLLVQRSNYLNNAGALSATSANARTSGFVAGVGTALSGASNIYQNNARAQIV